MINFLDLTTRRFDGGTFRLKPAQTADAATRRGAGELKERVPVLISRGIVIALWFASGIAFFALIFIAMFL